MEIVYYVKFSDKPERVFASTNWGLEHNRYEAALECWKMFGGDKPRFDCCPANVDAYGKATFII